MNIQSNADQFAIAHNKALADLAKIKTPSIYTASPKADDFLDVRDYLKEVAAVVDELILEAARIARMNASCHGVDLELGTDRVIGALDGFLFYDLEQEAIGVRAAHHACHGYSGQAYDPTEHKIGKFEAGVGRKAA